MKGNLIGLIKEGIAHLQGGGNVQEYLGREEAQRLPEAKREELYALLDTAARLQRLQTAVAIPYASQSVVAANRARFLSEAVRLRESRRAQPQPAWRWLRAPPQMLRGVVAVALSLVLVLSLGGGAVRAAAGSLPGSPLYPLKLAVEDTRLTLTFDEAQRATLYLCFASERAWEIVNLATTERPVDERVVARMSQQLLGAVEAARSIGGEPGNKLLGQVVETSYAQVEMLWEASAAAAPRTQVVLNAAIASAEQAASLARRALQPQPVAAATSTNVPPEPTQAPVSAVVETVTSVPSVTPYPATPVPTDTPTRLPTETPSATPTATATPAPTGTPVPTAMPVPTATPVPTQGPPAVFSLVNVDHPDPVPAGQAIQYDIYVLNDGDVPLTNAVLSASLSPADCGYMLPDHTLEAEYSLGTIEPHTQHLIRVVVNTWPANSERTLTTEAILTCDQGTARAVQTTSISP